MLCQIHNDVFNKYSLKKRALVDQQNLRALKFDIESK
jgi:hypothetical protein